MKSVAFSNQLATGHWGNFNSCIVPLRVVVCVCRSGRVSLIIYLTCFPYSNNDESLSRFLDCIYLVLNFAGRDGAAFE